MANPRQRWASVVVLAGLPHDVTRDPDQSSGLRSLSRLQRRKLPHHIIALRCESLWLRAIFEMGCAMAGEKPRTAFDTFFPLSRSRRLRNVFDILLFCIPLQSMLHCVARLSHPPTRLWSRLKSRSILGVLRQPDRSTPSGSAQRRVIGKAPTITSPTQTTKLISLHLTGIALDPVTQGPGHDRPQRSTGHFFRQTPRPRSLTPE